MKSTDQKTMIASDHIGRVHMVADQIKYSFGNLNYSVLSEFAIVVQ
jgi:hypothetical protein